MIKRAMKMAIWVSLGTMTGSVIIPRVFFHERVGDTFPALLVRAAISFAAGFIGAFIVCLITEWAKSKSANKEDLAGL